MVNTRYVQFFTAFLAAMLPFVVPRIQQLVTSLGLMRGELEPLNLATCTQIHKGVLQGCEDFAVVNNGDSRILYTACSADVNDRVRFWPPMGHFDEPEHGATVRDKLFALDLDTDELTELRTPNFVSNYLSHGIDVVPSKAGENAIYAINHLPKGSVVEKFVHKVGSKEAKHRATFRSKKFMWAPNDLYVIDEKRDAFFYSNDHSFLQGPLRMVETLFQWPTTNVGFHADGQWKFAAKMIANANGLSGDRKGHFFVNSVTAVSHLYRYDAEGNADWVQQVHVKHGIDNPFWSAETGEVLFAGFPKIGELTEFARNIHTQTAASAVSRVRVDSLLPFAPKPATKAEEEMQKKAGVTITPKVEEIFLDAGSGFANMTTSAAVDPKRDQLYLTGAFGNAVIRCDGYSKMQGRGKK